MTRACLFEMKILYETVPRRLFTFGCSFTSYDWATWANILGYELQLLHGCEFYNFGRAGAGNTYIANVISQVDQVYKFNSNDLVIVCWTSISREDRWKGGSWFTVGNIYNNSYYSKKLVNEIADRTHFLMRDLSYIKLIDSLLSSKTQYHLLSMSKICHEEFNDNKLSLMYEDVVNKISIDFYNLIWNDDMSNKYDRDCKELHKYYSEGHPTVEEHYEYVNKLFDYKFCNDTTLAVRNTHHQFKKLILEFYSDIKRLTHPSDFSTKKRKEFYRECEKLMICDPIIPSSQLLL